MKRDRINYIIGKAYGSRYDLGTPTPAFSPRSHFYLTRVQPVLTRIEPLGVLLKRRILIFSIILAAVLIGVTAHYFNLLVIADQNNCAARGRVQALLQRRHDTAVNLSKAVLDYAEHERAVLSAVVALRALSPGRQADDESLKDAKSGVTKLDKLQEIIGKLDGKASAPGAAPIAPEAQAPGGALPASSSLMSLSALAEQYPDLKLSANFQTLMNVLDQIEKDLAAERFKHDDLLDIYNTYVWTFPSNIFAKIFGFKAHPYFEATDEARSFKPINY